MYTKKYIIEKVTIHLSNKKHIRGIVRIDTKRRIITLSTNQKIEEKDVFCESYPIENLYLKLFNMNKIYIYAKTVEIHNFNTIKEKEIEKKFLYKYSCDYSFVSHICLEKKDDKIKNLTLNFKYLRDWLYNPDMTNISPQLISITPIIYKLETPSYKLIFSLKGDFPEYSGSVAKNIKVKLVSSVTIMYKNAKSIKDCYRDVIILKNFLVFHFDSVTNIISMVGEMDGIDFGIYVFGSGISLCKKKHLGYSIPNYIINLSSAEELERRYNFYLEKCKDTEIESIFEIYSKSLLHSRDIPEVSFLSCMRCMEKIIDTIVLSKPEIEKMILKEDYSKKTYGVVTLSAIKDIKEKDGNWYKRLRVKMYILLYMSMTDFEHEYFRHLIFRFFDYKHLLKPIDYLVDYRNECAHLPSQKVPNEVKPFFDDIIFSICKIMIATELLGIKFDDFTKQNIFPTQNYKRYYDVDKQKMCDR